MTNLEDKILMVLVKTSKSSELHSSFEVGYVYIQGNYRVYLKDSVHEKLLTCLPKRYEGTGKNIFSMLRLRSLLPLTF